MQLYKKLVKKFSAINAFYSFSKVNICAQNAAYFYGFRNSTAVFNLGLLFTKLYTSLLFFRLFLFADQSVWIVTINPEHRFLGGLLAKQRALLFYFGKWQKGLLTNTKRNTRKVKLPNLVVIFDSSKYGSLLNECYQLRVPVIAVSNAGLRLPKISYAILGNTQNFYFIWFLLQLFCTESLKNKLNDCIAN